MGYDMGPLYGEGQEQEIGELEKVIKLTCNSTFTPYEYAKTLCNAGYHKTIWHKVAEGDLPKRYQNIWFIDGRTNLGFSGYYNDIYGIFISDFDNDFCIEKDEVIAWTELPEYKRKVGENEIILSFKQTQEYRQAIAEVKPMKEKIHKETAKEIRDKIIANKNMPEPIKNEWKKWFNKECGVEIE